MMGRGEHLSELTVGGPDKNTRAHRSSAGKRTTGPIRNSSHAPRVEPPVHYFESSGGPLTRFPLRWKFTSTWSAILMNGMPLFIP